MNRNSIFCKLLFSPAIILLPNYLLTWDNNLSFTTVHTIFYHAHTNDRLGQTVYEVKSFVVLILGGQLLFLGTLS